MATGSTSPTEVREFLVTGVRSRTHLVHVAAYLRRELRRSARRATGFDVRYLTGGTFLGHASVDEADVRRLLPDDDRLHVHFVGPDAAWAPSATGELTYISVGAPGLKPWLALRRNGIRQRIHVVVTDEGLGTYGDWRTRRYALQRQRSGRGRATVRAGAIELGRRTLTGERFALYDKANDWAIEPDIAAEFRRDLGESTAGAVAKGPGTEASPADDRRVVLLTQPWVELGLVTEDTYRGFVDAVASTVAASGARLQVRPHPAEDPHRYESFAVLAGWAPAELDRSVTGADAVLGGTSTALLNLAAVYGLSATRLVVPGMEHLDDELGDDQRALLDRYLDAPRRPEELPRLWSAS